MIPTYVPTRSKIRLKKVATIENWRNLSLLVVKLLSDKNKNVKKKTHQ